MRSKRSPEPSSEVFRASHRNLLGPGRVFSSVFLLLGFNFVRLHFLSSFSHSTFPSITCSLVQRTIILIISPFNLVSTFCQTLSVNRVEFCAQSATDLQDVLRVSKCSSVPGSRVMWVGVVSSARFHTALVGKATLISYVSGSSEEICSVIH